VPDFCRRSRVLLLSLVLAAPSAGALAAEPLPTVASINVCADQHVLALADPEQILTVSWLAADPEESLFAAEARRHTLNYGTAEELLKFTPDLVLAGIYTSPFTRAMLRRLGYRVVELAPETSVADIARNVRLVAELVGQSARGGFTVGVDNLSHELLVLAGLRNVAAEQGLDRWGSLSMEGLLRSAPELIVLTGYRSAQPSLANAVLEHPALRRLGALQRTATVPSALWACGLPRSLESAVLLQQAALR
jgi:iron complex transport system substrate-binding protein